MRILLAHLYIVAADTSAVGRVGSLQVAVDKPQIAVGIPFGLECIVGLGQGSQGSDSGNLVVVELPFVLQTNSTEQW